VDGIEKCRPQNASTTTNISTGKIVKGDSGYQYHYQIFDQRSDENDSNPLSYIIANQLAAFRNAYGIPQKDLVNIFFLENLLTQDDLNNDNGWIDELEKVYEESDPYFCLFRVAFVYDIEKPYNVNAQIDCDVLETLLSEHKQSIQHGFQRYLFYIDNQKFGAAALCLSKEEHDLKLPRILMDFMMLVSNANDKYNVMQAINHPTVRTNCFSIGYAESMYYYPDVERYFTHADNKELLQCFLNDPDETNEDISMVAMDVEKYPFGLYARQDKLAKIYEDVPFSEDINQYPLTADKKIDDCVVMLKECIYKKREKECAAFQQAEEDRIEGVRSDLEKITHELENIGQNEGESEEDFTKRKQELQAKKESLKQDLVSLEEGLVGKIDQFAPKFPAYINRATIYQDLCVADDADASAKEGEQRYDALIHSIVSKEFLDFVRENDALVSPVEPVNDRVDSNNQKKAKGCFLGLLIEAVKLLWNRLRGRKNVVHEEVADSKEDAPVAPITAQNGIEAILMIREQLKLKQAHKSFKEQVATMQEECKVEDEACDNFKLTDHTNHYYPLIDVDKLKAEYNKTSQQRRTHVISQWKNSRNKTKTTLVDSAKKETEKYTRQNFRYIDWDNPFSFVSRLEATDNMPDVCNKLQNRADPFVNFNQTSAIDQNIIFKYMYSNRPKFEQEFNTMRPHLENSTDVVAFRSSHIESKICFMEILPMDDQVLNNLILKKKNGEDAPFEVGGPEDMQEGESSE
jgi:hypothetical protein